MSERGRARASRSREVAKVKRNDSTRAPRADDASAPPSPAIELAHEVVHVGTPARVARPGVPPPPPRCVCVALGSPPPFFFFCFFFPPPPAPPPAPPARARAAVQLHALDRGLELVPPRLHGEHPVARVHDGPHDARLADPDAVPDRGRVLGVVEPEPEPERVTRRRRRRVPRSAARPRPSSRRERVHARRAGVPRGDRASRSAARGPPPPNPAPRPRQIL